MSSESSSEGDSVGYVFDDDRLGLSAVDIVTRFGSAVGECYAYLLAYSNTHDSSLDEYVQSLAKLCDLSTDVCSLLMRIEGSAAGSVAEVSASDSLAVLAANTRFFQEFSKWVSYDGAAMDAGVRDMWVVMFGQFLNSLSSSVSPATSSALEPMKFLDTRALILSSVPAATSVITRSR